MKLLKTKVREKNLNRLENKRHITFKGATLRMPADYGYQNNKRIILLKKGEKVPANLENYPEQKYPSKMNIK